MRVLDEAFDREWAIGPEAIDDQDSWNSLPLAVTLCELSILPLVFDQVTEFQREIVDTAKRSRFGWKTATSLSLGIAIAALFLMVAMTFVVMVNDIWLSWRYQLLSQVMRYDLLAGVVCLGLWYWFDELETKANKELSWKTDFLDESLTSLPLLENYLVEARLIKARMHEAQFLLETFSKNCFLMVKYEEEKFYLGFWLLD